MSPASSRAQMRQRRNLLVSVLAVVVIAVGSFAAVFSAKWTPRLGLDLAGGLSVVYQTAKTVSPAELQETVAILNNRVNGLGVSGAQVSTAGNNEISVSIPGVKDAAALLNEIGNTAQLFFRPVLCTAYPLSLSPATKATKTSPAKPAEKAISGNKTLPACGADYATTLENLAVTPNSSVQGYSSNNPSPDPSFAQYTSTSTDVNNYPNRTVLLPSLPAAGSSTKGSLRYVLGPEQMTGNSIGSAEAQQSQTGQWEVNYTLRGAAGSALVGQGRQGELPPPPRDRARRRGPIGAAHPAHAGRVHLVRRSGHDQRGQHDRGRCQVVGPGHGVRLPSRPPQAADDADRVAHARQVRPAGRARGRYRRSHPRSALRGALLPGVGAGGDLGAGADGHGALGHHLGARAIPRSARVSTWRASRA